MISRGFPELASLSFRSPSWTTSSGYARIGLLLALVLTIPLAGSAGLVGILPGVAATVETSDDDEDGLMERVHRDQSTCELRKRIAHSRQVRLSHHHEPLKLTSVHHAASMELSHSVNIPPLHSPLRC